MPLLDDQQHEQVTEMIRAGLQRGFEVHIGQPTTAQTQLTTPADQSRASTEDFVSRQNMHNEQISARLAEFTTETQNQISTLRQQPGAEFAKGDAKVAEINEKMTQFDKAFEHKQIALTLEISASFAEFGSKCSEMRTLIEQPGTVLETSKQIINGLSLRRTRGSTR